VPRKLATTIHADNDAAIAKLTALN